MRKSRLSAAMLAAALFVGSPVLVSTGGVANAQPGATATASALASARTKIASGDVQGGLAVYNGVLLQDPTNVDALTGSAVWNTEQGVTLGALTATALLPADRRNAVNHLLTSISTALNAPQTTSVPLFLPANTAIVVLGFGLQADGTMRDILLERLRAGLKAAQTFPQAPILVTGGNPESGKTEGGQMKNWLVSQGISANRIIAETHASSTVGNALNSTKLLKAAGVTQVLLTSSSNHVVRGTADFFTAGMPVFASLSSDSASVGAAQSSGSLIAIYRDALAVAGL